MKEHVINRIAFVGAGNMGQAIIRGLIETNTVAADRIWVSDRRSAVLNHCRDELGVETAASNTDLVKGADIVVLSVKPQIVDDVLDEIRGSLADSALVVSIAAGKSTRSIERRLKAGARVVRAMPNVCSLVGEGATGVARGAHATDNDMASAKTLFDAVGMSVVLDETLIDAVTGLSASGPAFIFMVIEALSDAGVKIGLARWDAHALACQTVFGAAKLTMKTKEHPGRLKDMVCSPGGTAIAGLHRLEAGGLRTTLIDAVEVAAGRARELGGAEDGC